MIRNNRIDIYFSEHPGTHGDTFTKNCLSTMYVCLIYLWENQCSELSACCGAQIVFCFVFFLFRIILHFLLLQVVKNRRQG